MDLADWRRLVASVAAALVAFLVVAGCGGSDSSTPLTKAEFAKRGTEICETAASGRTQASKEAAKQSGSGGTKEGKEITEALLDPVRKMTEELAELTPPKNQAKALEALVSALEAGIAKIEAEPAGGETASAFSKANELTKEVDLTACEV